MSYLSKGGYVKIFTVAFLSMNIFCLPHSTYATSLESLQSSTIQKLEGIESKVDSVLDKVESKTRSVELKENIEQNQEEIDELMGEQTQAIQEATSVEEIKEIVVETAKRVILKTYDGVTDKDSIEDSLTVEGSVEEKAEAVEVALESMVDEGGYTIQLTTKGSFEGAMKRLKLFDGEIKGRLLFETDGETTVEVKVDENSLLSQEILSDLGQGEVPDSLVGFRINKPQVYTLESIDLGKEKLESLWGIEEYATYNYLEDVPSKVITVGVVDTGIDLEHPDLKDRISKTIQGYNFVDKNDNPSDDHYHGTHVAGTIAGSMNGEGVLGVNPRVEIVPLKICGANGMCDSYAIANAVKYAADQGVDILNMSLGGRGSIRNNSTCDAIQYAVGKGVIPVVAAGNANSPVSDFIPGGCPNTITVGAYDSEKQRASFSNYGPGVDVSAPGVGIYSAKPGGYKETSGTSMATPHVVGVLSLLMSKKEGLTVETARMLLRSFPVPIITEGRKPIGVGIDVPKLLESIGLKKGTVTCGEEVCTNEEEQVQEEEKPKGPPIVISDEEVEVEVGGEVKVTVSGGKGPYKILRNEEIVGLWYDSQSGVGVASAEGEGFSSDGRDEEVFIESVINEEEELKKIQTLFDEQEEETQENEEGTEQIELEETNEEPVGLEEYEEEISEEELLQQREERQEQEENTEGVGIASAGKQFGLIGLKPGQTTVTIIDAEGSEKYMSVIVKPKVFVMNNRRRMYVGPMSNGYRLDSSIQTNRYLVGGYLKNSRYYRMYSARRGHGLSDFKARIYNTTEKKYQTLHWQIYVGGSYGRSGRPQYVKKNPQPKYTHIIEKIEIPELEVSHKVVKIRVGEVKRLSISGGRPTYTLKREKGLVGFAYSSRPRYGQSTNQGIAIASAGEEVADFEAEQTTEESEEHEGEDGALGGAIDTSTFTQENDGVLSDEELRNLIESENQAEVQEDLPEEIKALETQPEKVIETAAGYEESIEIASSSKSFQVLGLKPGVEKIAIIDSFGNKETITVTILPKTFVVRPWGYFGMYTNRSIYSFSSIRKADNLKGMRIRRGYQVRGYGGNKQGLQPFVLNVSNYHEGKTQSLHYQVFIGTSSQRKNHATRYGELYKAEPLTVNHETFELNVGQTKTLEIGGGLGGYGVKKSNEHVGLGDGGGGVSIASAGELERELAIEQGTDEYEEPLEDEEAQEELESEGEEREPQEETELDAGLFQDEEETVGVASSVQKKKIKLLGLVPGTTTIKVTDAGGQEKNVIVTVKETKFRMRPGTRSYVGGNSLWSIPRREVMTIPSNLLGMRYYRRGRWKLSSNRYADDEAVMKRTIYNHYEKKKQTMERLLRVSPTKERLPLELSQEETIEMTVGEKRTLDVSGGSPRYKVSHSNALVRLQYPRYKTAGYKVDFVKRKNSGIGIASAGEEIDEQTNEVQGYETPDLDEPLSPEELEEEQRLEEEELEGEEDEDISIEQLGGIQQEEEGVGIASSSSKHRIEIYANKPGESVIKVEDKRGELRELRVVVKEKVVKAKVGDQYSWYYRSQRNQPFHVSNLTSSNPDIIKTSYRRGRYRAEVLQPGKATLTVGIASRRRARPYTYMTFTILTKPDKPLSVSEERVTVVAGERKDIHIVGGLAKYTVSKSNENVGLGNINATRAIGVAGVEGNKAITNQGDTQEVEHDYELQQVGEDRYVPVEEETELPDKIIIGGEEIVMEYEGLEEEEEEVEVAGTSTLKAKKNRLSIIGMKPGTSTVTIRDEFGDEKQVVVEVLESEVEYETIYDLSRDHTMSKYKYRADMLSRGKYDRTEKPYKVEKVISKDPLVFRPYFRKRKGWYGMGGIGGETRVVYEVYLPLEKKKGVIEYEVEVEGPTIEEVNAHWKKVLARRALFSGKRSSIGGGGSSSSSSNSQNSSSNNTSSNNSQSSANSQNNNTNTNNSSSNSSDNGNGSSSTVIDQIYELLKQVGIDTSDISTLSVASVEGAHRCELGNTNTFYTRPYNGSCVDNNNTIARQCNSGYIDLSVGSDGGYTCVSKEFLNNDYSIKDQSLRVARDEIRKIVSRGLNSENSKNIYDKLVLFRSERNIQNYNIDLTNYIIDDLLHYLDRNGDKQRINKDDLIGFHTAMVASSNNGVAPGGDGGILYNEYTGKSRSDVEVYVKRYAEKLQEYLLEYDSDYKEGLDRKIQEGVEKGGDKGDIEQGLMDGVIEGTTSYIMDYYDLAGTLYNLTFKQIYDGVKSLWKRASDFVSNPLATLAGFVDQLEEIKERILIMDGYEWGKSTTFVGSNVGLNSVDPASNITAALGAGMVVKVNKYVGKLGLVSLSKKIDWFDSKFTSEGKYIKGQLPITSKQGKELAEKIGYSEVPNVFSKNEKIFYNSKAKSDKKYITLDVGSSRNSPSHNGGIWKGSNKVDGFSYSKRSGTYNANLDLKLGE